MTGTTLPRRLITPRMNEGISGTRVTLPYSMISLTTGKLTSGSPPWNSMVMKPLVLDSARSTALRAVSTLMSVWTASMFAREAWQ